MLAKDDKGDRQATEAVDGNNVKVPFLVGIEYKETFYR